MNTDTRKEIFFWTAVIGGIALVVAGMIFLVSLQRIPVGNGEPVTIENVIAADDWVKGNRDAKVTLVEYSDFQCPACASYQPVVKQLLEEYSDRIAFVYRHFPLPNHTQAKPMAYAAEAAGKQEKFWEMHDMIFENQSDWAKNGNNPKDTAMEYARDLGLDTARFENDYSSDEIRRKVDDAVSTGRNIGISYTPTFFVNGVRIANPNSYAQFIEIINQAEAEANAETTSGTDTSPGQTTTFTSTSSLKTTNN